jgi:hypothetical protein
MAYLPGGASGLLCRDYTGLSGRHRLALRVVATRATSRRGIGPVEDPHRGAQAPRRLAGGDHARHDLCEGATRRDGTQSAGTGAGTGRNLQLDRPSGAGEASPPSRIPAVDPDPSLLRVPHDACTETSALAPTQHKDLLGAEDHHLQPACRSAIGGGYRRDSHPFGIQDAPAEAACGDLGWRRGRPRGGLAIGRHSLRRN